MALHINIYGLKSRNFMRSCHPWLAFWYYTKIKKPLYRNTFRPYAALSTLPFTTLASLAMNSPLVGLPRLAEMVLPKYFSRVSRSPRHQVTSMRCRMARWKYHLLGYSWHKCSSVYWIVPIIAKTGSQSKACIVPVLISCSSLTAKQEKIFKFDLWRGWAIDSWDLSYTSIARENLSIEKRFFYQKNSTHMRSVAWWFFGKDRPGKGRPKIKRGQQSAALWRYENTQH